ncbi:hypothetical protein GW17_00016056 [Ensete ventricosum]|uniref:Uncharacterized protein n=1 Tax=Ensete ventricosum TaxID=4639 RepID=A0A426YV17_ENSVE|nr:hypothetical protein B296_00034731 [Ensete ventricosum]RWW19862.1 hypothetical protein GW17_00016056 [Ensete ventricosum]RZR85463.1 hypothetical protein BHM03_00012452 [Ensete ventricosum]
MARRKHASMRERSTAIAGNVLKASVLALAKMALGTTRAAPSRIAPGAPLPPPTARAMRLVEPESHCPAFLMEPGDEGDGVDGRAEAYITKVRAKLWSDSGARSPPPTAKYATYSAG